MASFRGITFGERGDGGTSFPVAARSAAATVVHVPGGDRNVIQDAGRNADTLRFTARCTASELASLRGAVGQRGTFIYAGGTPSMYLQAIEASEIFASGIYFAVLTLVAT